MVYSINFLKELAINVYEIVNPLLGTQEAATKNKRGAGGDISMDIDLVAEDSIIQFLEDKKANLLLISEEIGEKYIGDKEIAKKKKEILIIDPIDGSNNAVRGVPYCSVSIAYAIGNKTENIEKAVVLDLNTKDLYWAEKGKGSYLNNSSISVSNFEIAQECLFEINLPMRNLMKNLSKLEPLLRKFYKIRILGSSALTLCQIAKGSIDGFINMRKSNRLVDVAAGMLILKEAGGRIFTFEGRQPENRLSINVKFPFIACNARLEHFLKDQLINKAK